MPAKLILSHAVPHSSPMKWNDDGRAVVHERSRSSCQFTVHQPCHRPVSVPRLSADDALFDGKDTDADFQQHLHQSSTNILCAASTNSNSTLNTHRPAPPATRLAFLTLPTVSHLLQEAEATHTPRNTVISRVLELTGVVASPHPACHALVRRRIDASANTTQHLPGSRRVLGLHVKRPNRDCLFECSSTARSRVAQAERPAAAHHHHFSAGFIAPKDRLKSAETNEHPRPG
nr:hypothetical protein CFP56_33775 [Quercus suber]